MCDSGRVSTQVKDDHITTPHAGQARNQLRVRFQLESHSNFVPSGLEALHEFCRGFFGDHQRPWNSKESTGGSKGSGKLSIQSLVWFSCHQHIIWAGRWDQSLSASKF